MSKIIDRTGKGAAINQSEFDANYDSLHGINQVVAGTTKTVTIADQGDTIEFTNAGAVAVTLDSMATIIAALHTSDFECGFINTGAGTVTITPNALNSLNTGDATIVLKTDEYARIQTDSTGLIWNVFGNYNVHKKTNSADFSLSLDRSTAQNYVIFDNGAGHLIYFYGNDATANLNVGLYDAGNTRPVWDYIEATDVVNFTSTLQQGGSEVSRIEQKAPTSLSGTQTDITGVPSWAKKVTIRVNNASFSTDNQSINVEVGTSGGMVASGYDGYYGWANTDNTNSTGQASNGPYLSVLQDAINDTHGEVILINTTGNKWTWHSNGIFGGQMCKSHGEITLTGTLDRFRVTSINGTASFDAGTVEALYEG